MTPAPTTAPKDESPRSPRRESGAANDVDFTFAYTPAHELRTESASIAAYVWQPSATASSSYTP